MNSKLSHIKTWHRMDINRKKYISTRLWKKAGMSRERFERITMAVPQEYLNEIRISAEADVFMETIFGKEMTEEFD